MCCILRLFGLRAFTCCTYCVSRLYTSVSCVLMCRRFAKNSLRYSEIFASTPAPKLIVTTISGPLFTLSGCCSGIRHFFPFPLHGILHLPPASTWVFDPCTFSLHDAACRNNHLLPSKHHYRTCYALAEINAMHVAQYCLRWDFRLTLSFYLFTYFLYITCAIRSL